MVNFRCLNFVAGEITPPPPIPRAGTSGRGDGLFSWSTLTPSLKHCREVWWRGVFQAAADQVPTWAARCALCPAVQQPGSQPFALMYCCAHTDLCWPTAQPAPSCCRTVGDGACHWWQSWPTFFTLRMTPGDRCCYSFWGLRNRGLETGHSYHWLPDISVITGVLSCPSVPDTLYPHPDLLSWLILQPQDMHLCVLQ